MTATRSAPAPLASTAFDCQNVKSVRAWGLLFPDAGVLKQAGRLVANYSDNPAGAVCTASIVAWGGPLADMYGARTYDPRNATGRAGGGGYCKFSAAVEDAHHRGSGERPSIELHGRGEGAVREWLDSLGYTVIEVI